MPTVISRAQAGLPPVPTSVGTRSLSSWTGIKVHHTGGAFSSWRAVHDWQTEGRPDDEELIYIGYSFGIANGRVTELRGWTRVPAHDHQNGTIGVVLGGNYQNALPPQEDLDALVWFCKEARLRTGKRLPITGHRDTWPRGDSRYSTCPGDALYRWLPTLRARVDNEEDDMSAAEVFDTPIPRPWDGNKTQQFKEFTAWRGNDIVRTRQTVEALKKTAAATLAAVQGLDTEAILARIDQRAAEDAARDQAMLDVLERHSSGALDAEAVVQRIGELLAAPADEG